MTYTSFPKSVIQMPTKCPREAKKMRPKRARQRYIVLELEYSLQQQAKEPYNLALRLPLRELARIKTWATETASKQRQATYWLISFAAALLRLLAASSTLGLVTAILSALYLAILLYDLLLLSTACGYVLLVATGLGLVFVGEFADMLVSFSAELPSTAVSKFILHFCLSCFMISEICWLTVTHMARDYRRFRVDLASNSDHDVVLAGDYQRMPPSQNVYTSLEEYLRLWAAGMWHVGAYDLFLPSLGMMCVLMDSKYEKVTYLGCAADLIILALAFRVLRTLFGSLFGSGPKSGLYKSGPFW